MTTTQLFFAITGVFVGVIGAQTTLMLLYINARVSSLNARVSSLEARMDIKFEAINQRFTDMIDLWRAELRRVEEVIDARLKHLEEN
jgi:hypothetical protein